MPNMAPSYPRRAWDNNTNNNTTAECTVILEQEEISPAILSTISADADIQLKMTDSDDMKDLNSESTMESSFFEDRSALRKSPARKKSKIEEKISIPRQSHQDEATVDPKMHSFDKVKDKAIKSSGDQRQTVQDTTTDATLSSDDLNTAKPNSAQNSYGALRMITDSVEATPTESQRKTSKQSKKKTNYSEFSFLETYLKGQMSNPISFCKNTDNTIPSEFLDSLNGDSTASSKPALMQPTSRMMSYSWKKDDLNRHLKKLMGARPQIDCGPPDVKVHNYMNFKKLHAADIHTKQLRVENERLVARIADAACLSQSAKPHVDCWNTMRALPFNPREKYRRQENERIAKANELLLKRLIKAGPSAEINRQKQLDNYERSRSDSCRLRQFPSLVCVTDFWDPTKKSTKFTYKHLKTKLPAINK